MYRETSRQVPLLSASSQLTASAARRLERSWSGAFHEVVYPVLLGAESEFRDLYSEDNGRPTWSIARMLGLVILREMRGLGSDQETVDALAFDVRWQHALGFGAEEEAYLSRRSLESFRARLHRHDEDGTRLQGLLAEVARAGSKRLGTRTSEQRLDSTLVRSNIRALNRAALVRTVTTRLVEAAKKQGLADELARAGLDDEKRSWAQTADLVDALTMLGALLEQLGDTVLSDTEVFADAARVFEEHVEPDPDPENTPSGQADTKAARKRRRREARGKGKNKKKVKPRKSSGAASMSSPFDRDAAVGHKGLGYHVQVAETCGNADAPELITHIDVRPANETDIKQLMPALDALDAHGLKPDTLLADAGYASGGTLHESSQRDVELVAPVARLRDDTISREDFAFDAKGHVIRCPAGHAPVRHAMRKDEGVTVLKVYFDRATCSACPQLAACPTRVRPSSPRHAADLNISPERRARDRRMREQQQPEWRERYALRSGIESTNSELKRAHGLGRLSVRGLVSVRQRALLKGIGCNAKRICRAAAAARRAA